MTGQTVDTDPKPAKTLGPLRMIWVEAVKYPSKVAFAWIALMVTAAATLAIPAGFKMVVDNGFASGGDVGDIGERFRYLLLIVVVLAVGTALRFYYVSWLGERVVADIRAKVQDNLLRLAPGFYEENSPTEIASRMTADTTLIQTVVGTTVSVALRNVLMAIGGTAYLFYLAPDLTMGLLVAIPLVMIPIILFSRRIRSISRSSQDRVADIGSMVSETLGAMRIVQAFNQEGREKSRFGGAVEAAFDVARRRILLRALLTAIIIAFIFGSITVVMWRGAIGVSEGTISGGTIIAFVLTGGLVAGAFGALTEVYGELLRGAGAASRLNELLYAQATIAPPARPQAMPDAAARIAVVPGRDVSLSHPPRNRRADRFQSGGGAGGNGRHRRPVGRGQEHGVPAGRAVLRPAGGLHPYRRGRPHQCRPRRNPPPHRAGAAGRGAVQRRMRATICATAIGTRATRTSGMPRARPMRKGSCASFRRVSTRFWAKAARACRAGSNSASPSPARFCAMRRSCCWTRRPARWMRRARRRCSRRSMA